MSDVKLSSKENNMSLVYLLRVLVGCPTITDDVRQQARDQITRLSVETSRRLPAPGDLCGLCGQRWEVSQNSVGVHHLCCLPVPHEDNCRYLISIHHDYMPREACSCGAEKATEPTWEDLRGIAPDATGTLSSEEFVRETRNAWDQK